MKEILLTKDKLALVDDCDYDMLMRHKWHGRYVEERATRDNRER